MYQVARIWFNAQVEPRHEQVSELIDIFGASDIDILGQEEMDLLSMLHTSEANASAERLCQGNCPMPTSSQTVDIEWA